MDVGEELGEGVCGSDAEGENLPVISRAKLEIRRLHWNKGRKGIFERMDC